MKLTDAWLRAHQGKPYSGKPEITYKNGLGIRISPKGKISWIYRFLLKGKPTKMKIGDYPAMKIKEACEERDRLAELVQNNMDPRNKTAIRLVARDPVTMSQLIDHYAENTLQRKNMRWKAIASMLRTSVNPYVGDYDVSKLELADFVELLNRERERAGGKHSGRLLSRLKTLMTYGVRNGYLKYNVLTPLTVPDVGEVPQPRKVKLTDIEIGALWCKIQAMPYPMCIVNLFSLSMIFAPRTVELRMAKKSHIDWEKKVWIVPEENNKMRGKGGGDIVRPIPKLAEEILRRQIALYPEAEYLFPQYFVYKDAPIDSSTPIRQSAKLAEAMEKEGFTGTKNHDMRRTARNAWEKLKFPYHVSESMLGHKVHTGTQAHYVDYGYVDEQRECYERWCDYILEMKDLFEKNSVVSIKRAASN